MSKFHRWLLRKVFIYRIFIAILRKFSLPGFQGVRIYTVLSFFFREFRSKDITTRASAISFNFFLALFPATIFFFTLIAYVPITNFQNEIFKFIENITPKEAFEAIRHTLEDILKNRQGGLLSLGFVLAFYFSATGINSLIDAFNDYTHSVTARKAFKQQLTAFWLTLYTTFLGILCVTLIIVGNVVLSFFKRKTRSGRFAGILSYTGQPVVSYHIVYILPYFRPVLLRPIKKAQVAVLFSRVHPGHHSFAAQHRSLFVLCKQFRFLQPPVRLYRYSYSYHAAYIYKLYGPAGRF